MPATFREALGDYEGDALVVVPELNERCLEVHPMEEWKRLGAKLQEQPRFDANARDASRLYFSRAHQISLDTAGRILLPPDLRAAVELRREVVVVGGFLPYFEIWDRARFEEFDREGKARTQEIQSKLADKGV